MRHDGRPALIVYGLRRLAMATREDPGELIALVSGAGEVPESVWDTYETVLSGGQERPPEEILTCIFSRIALEEERELPPSRYYSARPLALCSDVLFPKRRDEAQPAGFDLWRQFADEFRNAVEMALEPFFEVFYHLYRKYAWAVPCTYGEPGVSLFEQWKAVAALVFASGENWADGPADELTLIGGDIPGIQDFVYTITSKGAAKGLRGRSFFIQLLGDAVVRRILADLGLCLANVVYNAGGNFMVLGPEETQAREVVKKVRQRVNARLVEAIQGGTALVMEVMSVSPTDLFTPKRFESVRNGFVQKVAQAKNRPLQDLALEDSGDNKDSGWETLFGPKGKGSRLACAVCRVEVDEHNSKPLERTGEEVEGTEQPRICCLCESFAGLARDIRHDELWMRIVEEPEMLDTEVEPTDGWEKLLARMTGFRYAFRDSPSAEGDILLAINRLDFLDGEVHGFRLLANVTPLTTSEDIKYLREEAKWEEKDLPRECDIRSFTLLAHAAAVAGAIERIGVLRMDVDNLGQVFSEGVPDLTLPKLSALSGTLDLFFGGYLNELVRAQAKNDLYIIYAGGDDLFIVGAWHHLPDLAEAIRNAFKSFTGEHPALSLSGGITLEGARFPLYRAAERAGEAEGRAKRYTRSDERRKDALCFLGTVVGWEDWPLVREQKDNLLWLIGEDEENEAREEGKREKRLPRALLQVIQNIHHLYLTGLSEARRRVRRENRTRLADEKLRMPNPQMFFGRWTWMQVYALTRLARRYEKRVPAAPARLQQLQKALMQPATVRYNGLAARWVEYLTRADSRQQRRGNE